MNLAVLLLALAVMAACTGIAHAEIPSPYQQLKEGVPADRVVCASDRILMASPSGSPACVFEGSVEALTDRGFEQIDRVTEVPPHHETELAEPGPIPAGVASASNAFAVDFYKEVSAADDGSNMFFSPTSMHTAFSILYEGARHDTAAQIRDVFELEPDVTARRDAAAQTMSSLNRDDPHAVLELANSVWVADWFEPHGSYADIARNTYRASMEKVDFLDGGVEHINSWADEKTHGKISEVLTPNDVDALTAMAILNAIYFKGTWVTQFPVEDTRPSTFWKDGTSSVNADSMNVVGTFAYGQFDETQVLRMPYEGDRLSMLVVLPDGRDGIGQLQERLSQELVQRWQQDLQDTEVIVSMPKFETRTSYDLKPILQSLGMTDAFDSASADLLGILGVQPGEEYDGRNLYVTKAAHDGYVKVNEEGTEAAAATTITIGVTSATEQSYFIADHPFIFIIQDDESGAILFMGRVSDPTL